VAGEGAVYFDGVDAFSARMDELLGNPAKLQEMSASSRARFELAFTWTDILAQYEALLLNYLPATQATSRALEARRSANRPFASASSRREANEGAPLAEQTDQVGAEGRADRVA
jgi:hypothetical protein